MSKGDLQREFLYNSIQDIVSTIRAIDTKLHIVLGIFVLPFAFADKLVEATNYWCSRWNWDSLCAMQWWTCAYNHTRGCYHSDAINIAMNDWLKERR